MCGLTFYYCYNQNIHFFILFLVEYPYSTEKTPISPEEIKGWKDANVQITKTLWKEKKKEICFNTISFYA
jgi:hypothetical protein